MISNLPGTIVLVASMLLLAGCGQEAGETVGNVDLELLNPDGQKVLFWYQHTRRRETALLEMIREYNETNAHRIEVAGEFSGSYGDIYNKMLVALQGGALPSMVVAYQNQAMAYMEAEGLVNLQPYIDSPRWGLTSEQLADHVQSFLDQDNVGGVQVGFPPNRSMELLYYNAEWLRELGYGGPPASWEEFEAMCKAATRQPFSRAHNPEHSLGFYLEADASRLASMIFSRGGDLVNAQASAYTFTGREAVEALSMVQGLERQGALRLLGEQYQDQTEFSLGNVLFALRSSSGLPFFKTAIGETGVDFEWKVAAAPSGGEEPIVNVYGASISVCRTTPAKQLAAWLFLKWFTQPSQQARWVRASNYFPVRKSTAAELEDYFTENRNYETAYNLLEFGRSEPSLPGYQQVRRLTTDAMVEIVEGADVQEVLERLERRANATIDGD